MLLNEDERGMIACRVEEYTNRLVMGLGGDSEDFIDVLQGIVEANQTEDDEGEDPLGDHYEGEIEVDPDLLKPPAWSKYYEAE
jgi:hypothetical protein